MQLIKTVVHETEIEVLREHLIPYLNDIANDPEKAIQLSFCSCLSHIVQVFYENDPNETFALCGELLFPLLWNMHISNTDIVLRI